MAFKHVVLAVSAIVSSLVAPAAADTCSAVGNGTAIHIQRSLQLEYLQEQNNYWSTGNGKLKPSCILYPQSAQEVAAIVKILNKNDENFAIKSGGHNANKYFASIDGGPLISTKYLNEVTFDRTSMTVRCGPGNDWQDVQEALQPAGVTVVGGRIGEVGVGGYIVGGGLSFLSTEYGWAANNVVEFEVVLHNGTIVTASKDSHADLYGALKGGGNSFGIVTAYTMMAHPQGQIWGGNLLFPASKSEELLAAVREFTEHYDDEKAAIIMTAEQTVLGAVDIWIMFLFYDGPTPPDGVFNMFTDLKPITNNCKTRTYADLLTTNNFGVIKGSVYTITTETIPLPSAQDAPEILGAYHENWRNTTQSIITVPGLIGSIAYQPIPKRLARKARELGGDLLDLDDDVDRIILEFNYSYTFGASDEKVDEAIQKLYKGTAAITSKYQATGQLPDAYLPLFANDGYFRQDYFGRLRTVDFARSVQERYDPNGFFAERTGGFKM